MSSETKSETIYGTPVRLKKALAEYTLSDASSKLVSVLHTTWQQREAIREVIVTGDDCIFKDDIILFLENWGIEVSRLDSGPYSSAHQLHVPNLDERESDYPRIVSYFVHRFLGTSNCVPKKMTGEFLLFMSGFNGWNDVNHLRKFLEQTLSRVKSQTIELQRAIELSQELFPESVNVDKHIEPHAVPYLHIGRENYPFFSRSYLDSRFVEAYLGVGDSFGIAGNTFEIDQIGQEISNVLLLERISKNTQFVLKKNKDDCNGDQSRVLLPADAIQRLKQRLASTCWNAPFSLLIEREPAPNMHESDTVYKEYLVALNELRGTSNVPLKKELTKSVVGPPFNLPAGKSFKDVAVMVSSLYKVQFYLPGQAKPQPVAYSECNAMGTKSKEPLKCWLDFIEIVYNNGIFACKEHGFDNGSRRVRKFRVAEMLRFIFSTRDNPFHPFVSGVGWRLRLSVKTTSRDQLKFEERLFGDKQRRDSNDESDL